MAKSWLNWRHGTAVTVPRYGDIVIFDRTSNPAFGHVAFFEGWDNENVYVLGGNQGRQGGVTRTAYPRSRLRGFRRPNPQQGKPTVPEMTQVEPPKVSAPEAGAGIGGALVAIKSALDGDLVVGLIVLLTIGGVVGYLAWKRQNKRQRRRA